MGFIVGPLDGWALGLFDGLPVGALDGDPVGELVGGSEGATKDMGQEILDSVQQLQQVVANRNTCAHNIDSRVPVQLPKTVQASTQ